MADTPRVKSTGKTEISLLGMVSSRKQTSLLQEILFKKSSSPSTLRTVCRLGDEERRLMHLVPAPAVRELAGARDLAACSLHSLVSTILPAFSRQLWCRKNDGNT